MFWPTYLSCSCCTVSFSGVLLYSKTTICTYIYLMVTSLPLNLVGLWINPSAKLENFWLPFFPHVFQIPLPVFSVLYWYGFSVFTRCAPLVDAVLEVGLSLANFSPLTPPFDTRVPLSCLQERIISYDPSSMMLSWTSKGVRQKTTSVHAKVRNT